MYQAFLHADDSLEPKLALEGAAILAPLILPRVLSAGQLRLRCRTGVGGTASLESQGGRQVSVSLLAAPQNFPSFDMYMASGS